MRRKTRQLKRARSPSVVLLAVLSVCAAAPARAAGGEQARGLVSGDIMSWNLTLAGLFGAPFNLIPSNSVVYLQGSRVGETGSGVTFIYHGGGGDEAESEASPFGDRDCDPGDAFCIGETAPPENRFEAAARDPSEVEVIAPILPAVPEPAAWALILVGFASLGLFRVFARKALASK